MKGRPSEEALTVLYSRNRVGAVPEVEVFQIWFPKLK